MNIEIFKARPRGKLSTFDAFSYWTNLFGDRPTRVRVFRAWDLMVLIELPL